ncbi:MAG TPA: PAS domain-containing protein [Burkholderiales bacterium]|nr:PAS domain-containing protein [Burkholderiales bacterium]
MQPSQSFEQELELLRERLQEAEEMHRAISRGEVDAFVVGPGGDTRVLLLANAYQRYRQLVERMQQGAVTATPNGQILFANQRFADMLGVPLAQMYTAPVESYVGVGDRARLSGFLMLSARDSHVEVELRRRDGTSIPVRMSIASFADGYATVLVTDMRPMNWPAVAVDALDSIRNSLEKLNRDLAGDSAARGTLADITEEINGLARMIDEMLDVESLGRSRSKGNP